MTTATYASTKKKMEFINRTINKKELTNLLLDAYSEHGTAKAGVLANNLKNLGFRFATLAGVTISIDDLDVAGIKKGLMQEAEDTILASQQRYQRGEITEVERYTKVIDTWAETNERLTKSIIDTIDRLNPIYMMAFSGARGNISQVRQLIGMRGLMADSQGQIIDMPIKSNFREGLTVTEYIISSYGARKGLVDTALKTADSGYLTRRLVDVAQDVIITEEDCGTTKGVLMTPVYQGSSIVVSLEDRIVSRTSAETVSHPETGEVLVLAGDVINVATAKAIAESGITEVMVRSGITCETNFGICRKCYGWSLTNNKLVDMGEAIGIMAAQSIGEPGTQLTMRTFHTGGVFTGSSNKEFIYAKADGIVQEDMPVRDFRTRHGDIVDVSVRDTELHVQQANGKIDTYAIPFNATLLVSKAGKVVKKGDLLAEFEQGAGRGDVSRLTEKATKDINADISGKICFEGFDVDEKRDRQGNVSRSSNRNGTIWVLSGDVYNLPTSSELMVEDNTTVLEGDILAETLIHTEYGGEVRLPEDLQVQTEHLQGEEVNVITNGKELTVVIASTLPANANFVQTKKEMLWRVEDEQGEPLENYIIKAPHGTVVENGSILAELVDTSCSVPTSGELRYDGVEVDEQQIVTKAGSVLFIPEEIHQVSKDISLKAPGIDSGMFVKAGTELVSGVYARIDGVVHFIEENDIIHEVIVRPGELHRVNDVTSILTDDGAIVEAGQEVAPGIFAKERSMVTVTLLLDDPDEDIELDDPEDTSSFEYADVLIRPVQEIHVTPRSVTVEFASTETDHIRVVPVTQLQFADGAKLRAVDGTSLLRTSLVLQMSGYLGRLKGVTELHQLSEEDKELKVVVLENLTIRHESATTSRNKAIKTQLLVCNGDILGKGAPVVKTQVLAGSNGTILLPQTKRNNDVRRLLLVNPTHQTAVTLKGEALVKPNQFIRVGNALDSKGTACEISGQILSVDGKSVLIHHGRPNLISIGTLLQAENYALVQQGDVLATLIFERQKTGDIVQGLPKVEELLEGRRPKDIAVLAPYAAKAEITYEDDQPRLFLSNPDIGRTEISLSLGANLLVEDGMMVEPGQPLTDGSINPHDLLEVSGIEAVRKFLVEEVQRVYRSQGVEIADKHIEIIVRQMTRKVQIDEPGDTFLLGGEMVDVKVLNEANRQAEEQGVTPAQAHSVLLGITKASLNTESFISAASFQETTRVLTEAAVEGRMDVLRGLKENVIIGRLIPAGTGFPKFKDVRLDADDVASAASKNNARKPSAILQEIESMFGSPDVESMRDFFLDDEAMATLSTKRLEDDDLISDDSFAMDATGDDDFID